jgi:YD repeat-containing protein
MSDPDMGAWSYAYNPTGTLASQTDAKGQTIAFGYDTLDRLTSKTMPGGWVSSYVYDETSTSNDGIGQRTSIHTKLNGAMQSYARWEYDARGRTTLAGQSVAGVVTDLLYSYDSADRVATLEYYEAGETVRYGYDAAWRQTSVCSDLANTPCYVSNATYTALEQPASRPTGNGLTQTWTYNNVMARLSQLQIGNAFNRSYGYDDGGNITSITDNLNAANSQSYGYDQRDRLTSWTLNGTTQSYTYDTIGNLTSKPGQAVYSYGAQSASCAAGALNKAHAVVATGEGDGGEGQHGDYI